MESMFYECSSLSALDLSTFNTSNVTDMRSMFCGCSSLSTLDLSTFNTSNVTVMRCMFYGCSSLSNIRYNKDDKEIERSLKDVQRMKGQGTIDQ